MEDDRLARIKAALDDNHDWPSVYMFKFIVPSTNKKIAKVQALFNSQTADIRLNTSRKGNYTSVTAKEVMASAQQVLDTYREADKIEGLIAL